MILSNQDIQQLSAGTPPLLSPFAPKSLRLSSYDLTIGDEYYAGWDGHSRSIETERLKPGQSFTIPPHGVCFILSEETISLPPDITAKVSLRMSLVYSGLVLTSQPPFDPGYSGKVIVMVHNLSARPHDLKQGERMATIEFLRVGNPSPAGSLAAHRSVRDLLGQLTGPVSSSLSHIARQAASAQKRVSWLAGQVIIFLALIVAVLAVPGFYSYTSLFDRQADQKARLDEQRTRIDELTKTVEDQKVSFQTLRQELAAVRARADAAEAAVARSARENGRQR
jgi:deoxycytidine triphosphate deaminase